MRTTPNLEPTVKTDEAVTEETAAPATPDVWVEAEDIFAFHPRSDVLEQSHLSMKVALALFLFKLFGENLCVLLQIVLPPTTRDFDAQVLGDRQRDHVRLLPGTCPLLLRRHMLFKGNWNTLNSSETAQLFRSIDKSVGVVVDFAE